jgi:putative transposase
MTIIQSPLSIAYKRSVPIYNYDPTDRVTFDDAQHMTVVETTTDGHVFQTIDGLRHTYSHEQIYLMRAQDRIRVMRGYHSTGASKTITPFGGLDITEFGEDKVAKALFWQNMVDEYMRFEAIGKKHPVLKNEGFKQRKVSLGVKCVRFLLPILKRIVDERWEGANGSVQRSYKLVGPRQFKRLHDLYVDSGFNPLALVSLKRGPKARVTAHRDDLELWLEYAARYADRKRPSMRNCLLMLKAEVHRRNVEREGTGLREFTMPSRTCFENLIKGMGVYYLTAKRHTEDYARKKFAITQGGVLVERPGERVEMDEWMVDLSILFTHLRIWNVLTKEEQDAVKRIRVWLTVAIDCATKCILAMHFSHRKPSHRSSLAALEMIVTDKTPISQIVGTGMPWIYGLVPEALLTDAGSAFRDVRFRSTVAALRCEHIIPPSGQPAARGTIESFFHTCELRFMSYFDGRTFSNILQKGKVDPRGYASVNLDVFNRIFVRAIIDIYHTTPHSGLGGETPADAWERLSAFSAINQPISSIERRHLFGVELERAISDKGVRVFGVHYNSSELQRHRFEQQALPMSPPPRVKIRHGRLDISAVSFQLDNEWKEAKSTIGVPVSTTLVAWIGARANHLARVGEKAKAYLSVQLDAVNELVASGDAASATAGLGLDALVASDYDAFEKRYFKDMSFVDDLDGVVQELAVLRIPRNPLEVGIEAFDHLIGVEDGEKPSVAEPSGTAAVVETNVGSAFHQTTPDSPDDDGISFENSTGGENE